MINNIMIMASLEGDVHKEIKTKDEVKPKEEEKRKEKGSSGGGGTEGSSARKRKKDKKQVRVHT